MSDFVLNEFERNSPLWRRLKDHMTRERDKLRVQNDSPSLDDRATATLRGRIRALNELIALDAAPGVDP